VNAVSSFSCGNISRIEADCKHIPRREGLVFELLMCGRDPLLIESVWVPDSPSIVRTMLLAECAKDKTEISSCGK